MVELVGRQSYKNKKGLQILPDVSWRVSGRGKLAL